MAKTNIKQSRKILFSAILLLVMYLLIEAATFIVYSAVQKKPLSPTEFQVRRDAVMNDEVIRTPAEAISGIVMMHPYLGYVSDPEKVGGFSSEYGFYEDTEPILTADPNTFVVGIFGGSFASHVSTYSKDTLTTALKQHPRLANRNVVVQNLAIGGYKQPQQLFALMYFLALGGRFDVVINIDGYNELTIPAIENRPKQVSPFFPRTWFSMVSGLSDTTMLKAVGQIAILQDRRKSAAHTFSAPLLRYSFVANVIWGAYDAKLLRHQKQKEIDLSLQQVSKKDRVEVTGPHFNYDVERSVLFDELAAAWTTSSLQMKRVCDANRITYLHFLQPNQYVPDSKPMSDEERKKAYDPSNRYRQTIEIGYRHLSRQNTVLQREGVNFTDLTTIFASNKDVLYADDCCHLNKQGYDLIAERIAAVIRESLPQQ